MSVPNTNGGGAVVKLVNEKDKCVRRITLPKDNEMGYLSDAVQKAELRYLDDEGDYIFVSSKVELVEALRVAGKQNQILRLWVGDVKSAIEYAPTTGCTTRPNESKHQGQDKEGVLHNNNKDPTQYQQPSQGQQQQQRGADKLGGQPSALSQLAALNIAITEPGNEAKQVGQLLHECPFVQAAERHASRTRNMLQDQYTSMLSDMHARKETCVQEAQTALQRLHQQGEQQVQEQHNEGANANDTNDNKDNDREIKAASILEQLTIDLGTIAAEFRASVQHITCRIDDYFSSLSFEFLVPVHLSVGVMSRPERFDVMVPRTTRARDLRQLIINRMELAGISSLDYSESTLSLNLPSSSSPAPSKHAKASPAQRQQEHQLKNAHAKGKHLSIQDHSRPRSQSTGNKSGGSKYGLNIFSNLFKSRMHMLHPSEEILMLDAFNIEPTGALCLLHNVHNVAKKESGGLMKRFVAGVQQLADEVSGSAPRREQAVEQEKPIAPDALVHCDEVADSHDDVNAEDVESRRDPTPPIVETKEMEKPHLQVVVSAPDEALCVSDREGNGSVAVAEGEVAAEAAEAQEAWPMHVTVDKDNGSNKCANDDDDDEFECISAHRSKGSWAEQWSKVSQDGDPDAREYMMEFEHSPKSQQHTVFDSEAMRHLSEDLKELETKTGVVVDNLP